MSEWRRYRNPRAVLAQLVSHDAFVMLKEGLGVAEGAFAVWRMLELASAVRAFVLRGRRGNHLALHRAVREQLRAIESLAHLGGENAVREYCGLERLLKNPENGIPHDTFASAEWKRFTREAEGWVVRKAYRERPNR